MTQWPGDVDGDVLRRMSQHGFDFDRPCLVDFNVDFESWPPLAEALAILEREYPGSVAHPPSEELNGYVHFQVFSEVTYELVMRIQSHVSALMAPFGGVCESWGVMQE